METKLNYFNKYVSLEKCILRKDHYNGDNALNRFSAVMFLESGLYSWKSKKKIRELNKAAKKWPVPPCEIMLFPNKVEIHWYAKSFQMVLTKEQYVVLIKDFIYFIAKIQGFNLKFLKRCLIEEPNRTVLAVPNEMINFKPCFNSACFGSDENKSRVFLLEKISEEVL
ncbi:hypothetical protein U8Y98_21710 [Priestia megaterium]|uniref:hypothetical protein n=1 Tax=Priestia megaterium TaxID=1404 RepID=UPI002FDFE239